MRLSAEWRTSESSDTIVIVDEDNLVRAACRVNSSLLSKFLTDMGDLEAWTGDQPVVDAGRLPETWGEHVISRAYEGEVLAIDPQLFWDGIYRWFRSRGLDYDTHARSSSF